LLPPGTKIDTTNPDHWSFPVGTRFWKEFRYNNKKVETRLITRYGTGANDFLFVAYQWSADGKSATIVLPGGATDVAPIGPGAEGPMHDIPSQADCNTCHGKLVEKILGFSAIQLSHSLPGETMTTLIRDNLVTSAPEAGGYTVPGNAAEKAALGYLHGNCGNCHNDTGPTAGFYRLRLLVGQTTLDSTDAYKTAVNVPHTWFGAASVPPDAGLGAYRIHGGSADDSEILFRMGTRGNPGRQMPPVDSKISDTAGITMLKAWINTLPAPPEAGVDAGTDSSADATTDGADATTE